MEFFLFCLRRICEAHTLVLLAVQFKNVRRASKETELKMFVVVLRGWLRPWWPKRQCIIQFHALFCENVNEIMVELDSLIITAHSRAAVAAVAKKIEKKKKSRHCCDNRYHFGCHRITYPIERYAIVEYIISFRFVFILLRSLSLNPSI